MDDRELGILTGKVLGTLALLDFGHFFFERVSGGGWKKNDEPTGVIKKILCESDLCGTIFDPVRLGKAFYTCKTKGCN
jgi:hypothetical protein